MKKIRFLAILASVFLIAGAIILSCKSKASKEGAGTTQAEKWTVLFDGTSTAGWRGYGKEKFPEKGWGIDNGTLKLTGNGEGEAGGPGDIIYDKKFKDFRLKLEWKISVGGNSGILYLAQESADPIWKSAPEMQILDNDKHIDSNLGKDGNRKAGSLYDLIPAKPQNTKPAGEWNEVEIMVYQGTVVHKQNGETILEYHLGTPDWNKLVSESKFKDFPAFGKYVPGFIGLQDHGCDVWFRNIKILEL